MNDMTKKLEEYFKKFDDLKLFVCYYSDDDDDNKYRVEYTESPIATESYTFRDFYEKFWSKGYTKYISDSAVPDEIPMIEEFYAFINVEHYCVA